MSENPNIHAEVARTVPPIPPPYQGQDWDNLLKWGNDPDQVAHVVQGSDQEKGNALISVPHVIVQITIQPGDYRHGAFKDGKLIPDTGCGAEHPYAYLTAIIGPPKLWDKAKARKRLSEETVELFDPGDIIGYVEAGTGVYREILKYLEDNGRLVVPEGPDGGAFGESRFDTSGEFVGEWVCDGEHPEVRYADGTGKYRPGQAVFRHTWNVRLVCPRGLRVSEYQNDATKEGRTRYFG